MPIPPGHQTTFSFDLESPACPAIAPHLTAWAPKEWPLAADWRPVLDSFLDSEAGQSLAHFIQARLKSGAVIYPPQPLRALALTPLAQVRLVILGQDPYHGPGQAEGLAFSVAPGVRPPPSLRNIFKEVARDGAPEQAPRAQRDDGSLLSWAEQGVLLLNTCLSVEAGQAGSHANRGWEVLTDKIVLAVAAKKSPVVFMLWGAQARSKARLIVQGSAFADLTGTHHLLLEANHPSPLSAMRPPYAFIGCGHFGRANAFLRQHGCRPIDW